MNTLKYALSLSTGAFSGPMRGAMGAVSGFTGQLSKVGNIITGFASLPGAVQTLVEPFTKPITLAADIEALETSMGSLLKNRPAAKAFVADLLEFADSTPFNPEPVAATGKQLIAFGFAAKSVKPLLKDIGDLATGMDKPIDEVGDAFGRLKAGQFGEAFEALRRFGISLQDLQSEGLIFDKGGSFQGSADQAMEAVRRIIQRKFGGGMTDLSRSGKGMFSTFQGYWNAVRRDFGRPILESLKPVLDDATAKLKEWRPIAADFGTRIATAITTLRGVIQKGELGQALQVGFTIAGKELVNILFAGINGLIRAFFTGLSQGGKILTTIFQNKNLWEGLKQSFLVITDLFKAALKEGAADILALMPGMGTKSDLLRDQAQGEIGVAQQRSKLASGLFKAADIESVFAGAMQGIQLTGAAFQSGYKDAGTILDTRQDRETLGALLAPAALSISGFATTAEAARASLASIVPLAKTVYTSVPNPDGITNRKETILNPQAMERLLNPGGRGNEETLATRITARLMADPVMATIKQAVARIAENTATEPAGAVL